MRKACNRDWTVSVGNADEDASEVAASALVVGIPMAAATTLDDVLSSTLLLDRLVVAVASQFHVVSSSDAIKHWILSSLP